MRPQSRNVCWDVSKSDKGSPVILFECHGMKGNQQFKYNLVSLIYLFFQLKTPLNLYLKYYLFLGYISNLSSY